MDSEYDLPSQTNFEAILRNGVLSEPQLQGLQALYSFPRHAATAIQLSAVLGYKPGTGGANSVIGGAGKRISLELEIEPPWANEQRMNWFSIVADGVDSDDGFLWVMHSELADALESVGLVDNDQGIYTQPDEIMDASVYQEGTAYRVQVNIYERSGKARRKCIELYGTQCFVCEFDFESIWGSVGEGFIHVHHLVPLSEIGESYTPDPARDLRPVCPNCHAMIHRRSPPYSIVEAKELLQHRISEQRNN